MSLNVPLHKPKRPHLPPAPKRPEEIDPNIALKKRQLELKKKKAGLLARGRRSLIVNQGGSGSSAPTVGKTSLGGA